MATTIRPMQPGDLAACLGLSRQAGWNQIPADWSRFLHLGGTGCFVAENDRSGKVVGSVTACRLGEAGWISMLLVEASHRGSGIGRNLLTTAIVHLEHCGTRSIRLAATPLGRPLYESLGFRVDFALARFAGTPLVADPDPLEAPRHADEVAQFDREVTRTDRQRLIGRLLHDAPDSCRVVRDVSGTLTGYVLWREGANAAQIGPCGGGAEAGVLLLNAAAGALAGRPVIVDIPLSQHDAVSWAERAGLQRARPFWRMTRGEAIMEDLPRLWASSGAEMG